MSEQDSTEMQKLVMPPGEIYSAARSSFDLSQGGEIRSWLSERGMPTVDVSRYPAGSVQMSFTFEQWDALFAAVNALRPQQVSTR